MSESNEVEPEGNLERPTRRQFSGAEKKRHIAEMHALPRGEKGAWCQRRVQMSALGDFKRRC